ncbi:MAG: lysophospholipid acyltransferase family protein [Candidatus Hatepunaea meridiana]|nr:lysophospholipid acyltransferase family protein [Candidatus Hatepunaea meridiana]
MGRENVPLSGPFILASNHQSWFDPPMIGAGCPREIHYAAKKELFNIIILNRIIKYYNSIPIRRKGFERQALVKLGKVLDSGNGMIIFPEGHRFLDEKLHPPKAGVGMLAIRHRVPIIPVYVNGSARLFFQVFKRRLTLKYGKAITPEEISKFIVSGKKQHKALTDKVMRHIAETGGVEPPESCTNA